MYLDFPIDFPIYLNVRDDSEPFKNIHFLSKSLIHLLNCSFSDGKYRCSHQDYKIRDHRFPQANFLGYK